MAFTSVIKIRFDDVDGAGIVYYPQFFQFCHACFEDFFDTAASISYPELVRQRRGFPTVAIECTFEAPLVYGDIAIVELTVKRIGNTSVVFGYDVRRKRDGVLCFRAAVTTVFVDLDTVKPLPLTQELRTIFERHLSRGGEPTAKTYDEEG